MMLPLISVIIPVYQTKDYLHDCVNSVLCQTYNNLEIIIVDDGSTDGSGELCDKLAEIDPRIKVFHKENGGLSSSRNFGFSKCNGEYVTFVDSDDIISELMIEKLFSVIEISDSEISKISIVRKNSLEDCHTVEEDKFEILSCKKALNRIFHDGPQIISACGKLFKKNVICDIKFPDGRYFEDEYFTPRAYANSKSIVLNNSEMYFYMQRDNDSILRGKVNRKKILDSLWISKDRVGYFYTLNYKKIYINAIIDLFYKLNNLLKTSKCLEDVELESLLLNEIKEYKYKYFLIYILVKLKQGFYKLYKGKGI